MGTLFDRVQKWHLEVLRDGIQKSVDANAEGTATIDTTFASAIFSVDALEAAGRFAQATSKHARITELPDYLAAKVHVYIVENAFKEANERKMLPLPSFSIQDLESVFKTYRQTVFGPVEDVYHAEVQRLLVGETRSQDRSALELEINIRNARFSSDSYLLCMNTFLINALTIECTRTIKGTPFTDPVQLILGIHKEKVIPKLDEHTGILTIPDSEWDACRDAYFSELIGDPSNKQYKKLMQATIPTVPTSSTSA
ncbi:MAG: hypothetical protein ABIA93_03785 [Candidatus Woesearchaeota archaeon]